MRNVGRASGQSQDRWIQLLDGGSTTEAGGGAAHGSVAGLSTMDPPSQPDTMGAPVLAPPGTEPAMRPPSSAPTLPPAGDDVLAALTERIVSLEQRVSDLEELL